jgi:hypothetical protein
MQLYHSLVNSQSTSTRSTKEPTSPDKMQRADGTSTNREAKPNESSWKDVLDKGKVSGGKVSLASLMPEGFQSILSKSHRSRSKNSVRGSSLLSISLDGSVTGKGTGGSSSKRMKLSSAVASNSDNSVEQTINSHESSFVQKPSTHRIYLTPEEVPHNKSKLSLQMCWMRPNLDFTDEAVNKMIPPPYSFSVGELFQFQKIPDNNVSDRKYTSGAASNNNVKQLFSKTFTGEKQNTHNTSCGNIREILVKSNAEGRAIGHELAPYLTCSISFNVVDHSCTMDDTLIYHLKKLTHVQWMELFEIQDNITSSLPENTSLLQLKVMTPKQRLSFFHCISTSTLADYFITTPPKCITNDVDFQDFRELINTVIPFSSYFLQQRNNSVGAEGDFNNVYNKGILRNAIQDFKWYTLGPYGRQIEMDITQQLLGAP